MIGASFGSSCIDQTVLAPGTRHQHIGCQRSTQRALHRSNKPQHHHHHHYHYCSHHYCYCLGGKLCRFAQIHRRVRLVWQHSARQEIGKTQFDGGMLSILLSRHSIYICKCFHVMSQLRRIAAYLYARNKRFEESVELSKKVYFIFVYFEKTK